MNSPQFLNERTSNMKKQIGIMMVFGILLLTIPCITFIHKSDSQAVNANGASTVKILFTKSNKVEEVTLENYMIGAVLAQMPADFEPEALKAQAILAHTYILRRQITEQEDPDEKLNGADISDDSSLYQSYFTEDQAKEFYGDDYDKAYKNVSTAVSEVKDMVVTYDSQPIIVAFHAISCGKTESAKNLWDEDIPYLISVESSSDEQVEGFEKSTQISDSDLLEKLGEAFPDLDFSDLNSVEISKSTDTGVALIVNAGGNEISGTEFANALSLPSPCFTIEHKDGTYTFITKGYGHLIGMSQYGANFMAKDGSDYKEILAHYFPETKITKKAHS